MNRLLSYRLNVRADRGNLNDLLYLPPEGVRLPDKASLAQWRAPIVDQGEEGSCGAHAGRYAMATIRAKMGLRFVELSRQFLYNRILIVENKSAAVDTGCEIRSIPKALARYGICREGLWAYDRHSFSDEPTPDAIADATRFRPAEYKRIDPNCVDPIYAIRYAIAVDRLPVLIGVSVYQSMMSDAVARTGLVPLPIKGDKCIGGHALALDEYDFTGGAPVISGPNSWGQWGRGGCYSLPLDFVRSPDCANDVWVITR